MHKKIGPFNCFHSKTFLAGVRFISVFLISFQLKSVSSQAELVESMKRFGVSAQDLMNQAAKRQYELKDPAMRDDLAAARAVLKKHSMMLLTASKAYVRHPELAAAKANRDFVLRQVRPKTHSRKNYLLTITYNHGICTSRMLFFL